MRWYEKLFYGLALAAIVLIVFLFLIWFFSKTTVGLEPKPASFTEQIETPCSPIIKTEGPAPTALSDEGDYEWDQPFICGVPMIEETFKQNLEEPPRFDAPAYNTTIEPVKDPAEEPTPEINGFVLIWDDRLTEITEWEREILARTAWIEDRGSSIECQMGIVTIVLNRYFSGKYAKNNTEYASDLEFICRDTKQFSGGYMIDDVTPGQTQYDAVDVILNNGLIFPRNVVYCRDRQYHTFGIPYMVIDHTYFSANDSIYP